MYFFVLSLPWNTSLPAASRSHLVYSFLSHCLTRDSLQSGRSGVARSGSFKPLLQSFESDARLTVHAPTHQEQIENPKPQTRCHIGQLSLEDDGFALCRESVGDFGLNLRSGCRDRPQIRHLPSCYLPYAASMPAACDEFFGDLFADQERMVHRPADSAGSGLPRANSPEWSCNRTPRRSDDEC